MRSFDQSMKYLLQHAPIDFIGFALGNRTVRILQPVPSVLPARGRDVDGGYVIVCGDVAEGAEIPDEDKRLAHIELYRRHQSAKELGTDIAEAQVRLFRREGKLVLTHLWDLYGDPDAPVREERRFTFGADGSTCVYQRINLRGMSWGQLFSDAPPALWSLVALTRDGATTSVVEAASEAIKAHPTWSEDQRVGHLAVLGFVAEAEGVPGGLLHRVLSKEQLMESELYKEIFGEAQAKGMAMGQAKAVLSVLAARGISVSEPLRARILGCRDVATLDTWIRRAAVASTASAVVRTKAAQRGPARPALHASKA